ncbi:hypothetical protein ZWY2020_003286 [Hordeum vulgare]|nr:hypothetical protein ZWY2020_003286 [Hordeum vulgare]
MVQVQMERKERQRWRREEDAILRSYVRQYGPREWNLLAQRMNAPLDRDAKSCLERWKNYLRPGIKKGSLTDDEQRLVICLQAKHDNKWKKIAAEVPGRTAKRLGKWWEVFKEKRRSWTAEAARAQPRREGKVRVAARELRREACQGEAAGRGGTAAPPPHGSSHAPALDIVHRHQWRARL